MKKLSIRSVVLLCVLGFSGCAVLEDGFREPLTPDEEVTAAANSRLANDSMTARSTLSATIANGAATLYGTVPDQATRQRAVQILEDTPGVSMVRDHTRLR